MITQDALDAMNRELPVGSWVKRYRLINPLEDYDKEYQTRSAVFVAPSNNPVVFLEGFGGYVHLRSLVKCDAPKEASK